MDSVMDQLRQQIAYNEQIKGRTEAAKPAPDQPEVKRRGRPKSKATTTG